MKSPLDDSGGSTGKDSDCDTQVRITRSDTPGNPVSHIVSEFAIDRKTVLLGVLSRVPFKLQCPRRPVN